MKAHTAAAYLASLLAFAAPAAAQPVEVPGDAPGDDPAALPDPEFRGPEVHDGAWANEHGWGDPVDGDVREGSYAWAYQAWAQQRADQHVDARTRLDCADLSIALLCEYAALHGLPVEWRVYYPAERRFVTFRNTDRQFADAAAFQRWSMWFLGAMNLADNTDAVTYETWAGGDMVLMDWNQSDASPNFDGREVWHTYLIGVPNELVYYGNISGGEPLPVSRVTGGSRLEMVVDHPDRYGLSPRRFRLFRGQVHPPRLQEAEVIRVSRNLNLREGPGTDHPVVTLAARGERFPVLGRDGQWVQLQLPDGRRVWGHGMFLALEDVGSDVEAAPAEAPGLIGSLASNE